MIRIQSIQYWDIQIPMRFQFSQSNNISSVSSSLILKLVAENGAKAYGEACPRRYVTGESMDSVINDLKVVESYLRQKDFKSINDIKELVVEDLPGKIGLSSICAIEQALIDLWIKIGNEDIIRALNASPTKITYSGIIPLVKSKYLEAVLDQLTYFNFKQVKLKVDADLPTNLEKINIIRAALGTNIEIRLDANTGWTYEEAKQFIPAYLSTGINSFEQIFQKGKEQYMGKITRNFGQEAKIMADESLTTFTEAQYLIQNKLCNAFNLKISKNGGLFNSLKIYELAMKNGISCQLGAHFGESSLLTRAGVLFSCIANKLSANEGAFGLYLLKEDLVTNPLQMNRSGQIDTQQTRVNNHLNLEVLESNILNNSSQLAY